MRPVRSGACREKSPRHELAKPDGLKMTPIVSRDGHDAIAAAIAALLHDDLPYSPVGALYRPARHTAVIGGCRCRALGAAVTRMMRARHLRVEMPISGAEFRLVLIGVLQARRTYTRHAERRRAAPVPASTGGCRPTLPLFTFTPECAAIFWPSRPCRRA